MSDVTETLHSTVSDTSGSAPRERPDGRRLEYTPHLDGLRALAVYLVVAFHSNLGLFSGGFIGVDIFFVLSGYLVTRLLLADIQHLGHVNWRRFYSRRFRRILPAAAAVLLATAVLYERAATPSDVLDALGGFRAAFLYVANWFFIRRSTDYFATNITSSPVLHFWSLAIEEQFYAIWPLVLALLFVLTRNLRRHRSAALSGVVALIAGISLVNALRLADSNLNRAYYGTDTRAYQLLAGALLALTPQMFAAARRAAGFARLMVPVVVAALVLTATNLISMNPIRRGVVATALAGALIVALQVAQGGRTKSFFSNRAVTHLGMISYGVYLLHWPVIVLWTLNRPRRPVVLFVFTCVVATALASLSFQFLERPIRRSRRLDPFGGRTIAVGLAVSLLCGLVAIPLILRPGGSAISGAGSITSPLSHPAGRTLLDWRVAKQNHSPNVDCFHKTIGQCVITRGPGPHVLLVGDSHARVFIAPLMKIAKHRGFTLAVAQWYQCPWQLGLRWDVGGLNAPTCPTHEQDWYGRIIPQFKPDIILLAEQALDDPANPMRFVDDGRSLVPGAPGFETALETLSRRSLSELKSAARDVVVIEPIPFAPMDPLSCLSAEKSARKCTYVATGVTPLERFLRGAAPGLGVHTIDIDPLICPRLPICDPIVNKIIVKRDPSHLTATYARSLADAIESELEQAKVFSP